MNRILFLSAWVTILTGLPNSAEACRLFGRCARRLQYAPVCYSYGGCRPRRVVYGYPPPNFAFQINAWTGQPMAYTSSIPASRPQGLGHAIGPVGRVPVTPSPQAPIGGRPIAPVAPLNPRLQMRRPPPAEFLEVDETAQPNVATVPRSESLFPTQSWNRIRTGNEAEWQAARDGGHYFKDGRGHRWYVSKNISYAQLKSGRYNLNELAFVDSRYHRLLWYTGRTQSPATGSYAYSFGPNQIGSGVTLHANGEIRRLRVTPNESLPILTRRTTSPAPGTLPLRS